MSSTTDIHPDTVLASLLAKAERSNRRNNLTRMHELCRKQYEAESRDFSVPTIGRLAEADGIMKGRALYNAQSADYKALIEAWAAYAGPATPKPTKTLASHDYLMRIEDPAIRSIMQAIVTERDKLKAQLNTLKAHTQVVVDRRPLGATITSTTGAPVAVVELSAQLTPSEREALQKAVSADYLEDRGLKEGSHGEIVNERGRTIFDVGFAWAIRRVLGDSA
ncbi:gamma-mobile-trio protein GmtX [Aeromonas veronii]|uniref:Alpha/beta hydrolase n=1 Tax=Aeromonas veronii TaxID=654 RepID=A0A142E751_AERVE|nr:gamma-mobile-trio protein GmtX [Aeromonas veronii]AMQ41830.1 alpha/beta hydrolase [Aeromonas veronii]AMQ43878.1 alpha/beta hydrolase [Aeromonas veronii]AMQ43989.1 alpha/beta hydrolase [Aeromonas veronii]MCX0429187.1 gamma-mobile-trio protein GmtX [Aeromonas veronii]MCX0450060.1 gamma-mobile-trio protein GmtX [Aeromonas veronii]